MRAIHPGRIGAEYNKLLYTTFPRNELGEWDILAFVVTGVVLDVLLYLRR
jgi:hypothetical protein